MSDINERYNELTNNFGTDLQTRISAYSPNLKLQDYQRGYVTRYFVQKVNDKAAPIFEVSRRNYGELSSNVTLNKVSLRWRLTGPRQPTFNPKSGIMTDMGVHESNKKSIEIASENMPNLKLYLPNTAQFYKADSEIS